MATIDVKFEIQKQEKKVNQLQECLRNVRQQVHRKENVYFPSPDIFMVNADLREAKKQLAALNEVVQDNMYLDV